MIKDLTYKKTFWLCVLFGTFALPFGNFLAHFYLPSLIVWIILAFRKELQQPTTKQVLCFSLLILFYILHFVSYFFSQNKHEAGFQMEVKLAFVLMPVVFLFTEISKEQFRKIMRAFILGLVAASVFNLLRGTYFALTGDTSKLLSSGFSVFTHPSYFSMYVVFGFYFLLSSFLEKESLFKSRPLNIFFLVFLTVINFLLSSKMGWVTFILVLFYFLVRELVRRKKIIQMLSIAGLGIVVMFALYRFVPFVNEKVNNMIRATDSKQIDITTTESSGVRVLIWKTSKDLISQNYLYGIGTGDVQDKLKEEYIRHGYTGAAEKRLNAHSQFFESFLGLGIFGLINLLAIFITPFLIYRRKISGIAAWFLIIVFINCIVESMFQNQAGVVFFTFFYSVILISKQEDSQFITHNNS